MIRTHAGSSGTLARRRTLFLWTSLLFTCAVVVTSLLGNSALARGYYSAASNAALALRQQSTPTPQPSAAPPGTAPQQLRFRHITAEKGLSSQRVTEIVQDE